MAKVDIDDGNFDLEDFQVEDEVMSDAEDDFPSVGPTRSFKSPTVVPMAKVSESNGLETSNRSKIKVDLNKMSPVEENQKKAAKKVVLRHKKGVAQPKPLGSGWPEFQVLDECEDAEGPVAVTTAQSARLVNLKPNGTHVPMESEPQSHPAVVYGPIIQPLAALGPNRNVPNGVDHTIRQEEPADEVLDIEDPMESADTAVSVENESSGKMASVSPIKCQIAAKIPAKQLPDRKPEEYRSGGNSSRDDRRHHYHHSSSRDSHRRRSSSRRRPERSHHESSHRGSQKRRSPVVLDSKPVKQQAILRATGDTKPTRYGDLLKPELVKSTGKVPEAIAQKVSPIEDPGCCSKGPLSITTSESNRSSSRSSVAKCPSPQWSRDEIHRKNSAELKEITKIGSGANPSVSVVKTALPDDNLSSKVPPIDPSTSCTVNEEKQAEAADETAKSSKKVSVEDVMQYMKGLRSIEYDVRKYTCFYCNPCNSTMPTSYMWVEHSHTVEHCEATATWMRLNMGKLSTAGPAKTQRFLDEFSGPVAGAEFAVEFRNETDEVVGFICSLCNLYILSPTQLATHLGSFAHSEKFLERCRPELFLPPNRASKSYRRFTLPIGTTPEDIEKEDESRKRFILESVKEMVDHKGSGRLRSYVNSAKSSSGKSEPLVKQPVERVYNEDYAVKWKILGKNQSLANLDYERRQSNCTFVGLQYLLEIWTPTAQEPPVFFCRICDHLTTDYAEHCAALKHVLGYLSRNYPSVAECLSTESTSKEEFRRNLFAAAKLILSHENNSARVVNVLQLQLDRETDSFVAVHAGIAKRIVEKLKLSAVSSVRNRNESVQATISGLEDLIQSSQIEAASPPAYSPGRLMETTAKPSLPQEKKEERKGLQPKSSGNPIPNGSSYRKRTKSDAIRD